MAAEEEVVVVEEALIIIADVVVVDLMLEILEDDDDGLMLVLMLLEVKVLDVVEEIAGTTLVVVGILEVVEVLVEVGATDVLPEAAAQTNEVGPIIQAPLMLKDSKRMLFRAFRFAAVPKALKGTCIVIRPPVILVGTV